MNIYKDCIVDEYFENDEISDVEEGFMKGYLVILMWFKKTRIYGME